MDTVISSKIDYYELLGMDLSLLTAEQLMTIRRDVVGWEDEADWDTLKEPAWDAFIDFLTEMSDAVTNRKRQIRAMAADRRAIPSRRSDYCLTSIRNEVEKRRKELTDTHSIAQVRRQVEDHLRELYKQGGLTRREVYRRDGGLKYVQWGLSEWGDDAYAWVPRRRLDDLPPIYGKQASKKDTVFDYKKVLPSYIPKVLDAYGGPVSTFEIEEAIIGRIVPPLKLFETQLLQETEDSKGRESYDIEDDLIYREMERKHTNPLTDDEDKVLDLTEAKLTIKQIAEELGVSPRTVNNIKNSILAKKARFLAEQRASL